jgi:sugar phosphate isomerase/epimerase
MAVELAVTPDERWGLATADLAAAASAAGFAGLAIGADKVDDVAVAAYSTARLRCHEVLAFLPREDPKATLASAEQLAEAAERIGADWVLTAFPAAVSAEMQKVLRGCAAIFGAAGAGMAVEFSPLGPVSSIQKRLGRHRQR